jgi:hypothetical protein
MEVAVAAAAMERKPLPVGQLTRELILGGHTFKGS